jgi:hypothetical protein
MQKAPRKAELSLQASLLQVSPTSVAEEQPQQNDHRDRHANHPKQ